MAGISITCEGWHIAWPGTDGAALVAFGAPGLIVLLVLLLIGGIILPAVVVLGWQYLFLYGPDAQSTIYREQAQITLAPLGLYDAWGVAPQAILFAVATGFWLRQGWHGDTQKTPPPAWRCWLAVGVLLLHLLAGIL